MVEAIEARLRYIRPRRAIFKDWWKTVAPFNRMLSFPKLHLRSGPVFRVRDTISSDVRVIIQIFQEKSYEIIADMDLPEDANILDIGANIGAFSCYVKSVLPYANIRAYEPDSENFRLLYENCPEVSCHNVAVTSRIGTSKLYLNDAHTGSTLVRRNVNPRIKDPKVQEVRNMTLAGILADIDRVDLAKIDIEGGEYDVFFGTGDKLFEKIGHLLLETHWSQGKWTEGDLLRRIKDLGFSTVKIIDKSTYYFRR